MATSVHEVIEAFRTLPSNSERGTKFEELMVRYFQLDPTLSQEYEHVWRWMDYPGRDGKVDTGIDLVAQQRDTGNLTAIQCKFYEPTHTLAKADIDSFFTASGKKRFANRVIISTTDRWSSHAEAALADQAVAVQRIGLAEIADSPIDWDIAWPADDLIITLSPARKHQPRPHQVKAIDAVMNGFAAGNDRGKLIMACGTGKTFTALKIAERVAQDNGGAARVLFLVPSISLLSQSLREWTAQSEQDIRAFGVCSDSRVSRAAEDLHAHDVTVPVTTDPERLATEMAHRRRAAGLTVVFSTYQSLPVIADAQHHHGVDGFDLVICDEAHRTTGVTLAGNDESNFVRIHDADYIQATRRLYMTATPKIFGEKAIEKAEEHSAEITSMDNEEDFGPQFHRLPFGAAVDAGLLSDYKVLVLTVDESVIAGSLQNQLAGNYAELPLDDASKFVGCWNGLAKRAGSSPDGLSFPPGSIPMRRAVAFARDIKSSKRVEAVFPAVADAYRDLLAQHTDSDDGAAGNAGADLACQVRHVDGTFNALERNRQLAWLKAPIPDGECRILSNARCLSEGVDVPALDAVLFLHPRNSVVDVVQSVGRVMRKSDDKDYGYVILPVAVPAGISPSEALADNRRFKVVWDVLNALRAHDDRFNAMINSIQLNTGKDGNKAVGTDQLLGGHIGPELDIDESLVPANDDGDSTLTDPDTDAALATQMGLFSLSQWQEAIFARIVDKVGTRVYWEKWAEDVADIAGRLITRINEALKQATIQHSAKLNNDVALILDNIESGNDADGDAERTTWQEFEAFHKGLRDNLNDSITRADAVGMLAQHLITRPVFDALFAGHQFAASNPVSQAMQHMVDVLGGAGLDAETDQLQGFYDSVRRRAAEVVSAEGKQQLIAELYERFFRIGFAKQAEALGIVFTPTEVVDFILHAVDHALRAELGRGLTDDGVHILDPFTGTGTFITRLLQSGLITSHDLARKYATELHANEIMLLAYYIAAVNIETTYHALTSAPRTDGTEKPTEYQPFDGIVLADTFQITEAGDTFDETMFPANNDRITRQLQTPITVIVGNPPYSVGQGSANDLNANVKYSTLDGRIAETYAKRSTATLKNSLYDSYLRALRWATDRIGDSGIVAFVMNGGWIDGNTADGIRLSLTGEYTTIYVYNLKGNMRKSNWKQEGGQIFGAGSQATIAIIVGIKNPAQTGPCRIHYRDIGDYLTRGEKLHILNESTLNGDGWAAITPNAQGDWINQRDESFATWPAIGEKKRESEQVTIFADYSRGLATSRDPWVYSFSTDRLAENVTSTIDFYNSEVDRIAALQASLPDVNAVITVDSTKFSWDRINKRQVMQGRRIRLDQSGFRVGVYRPFMKQHVYFDRNQQVNNCTYRLPSMFPTPHHTNIGIYAVGFGSAVPFSALMLDSLPDLHVTGAGSGGQFFPRWTYEKADAATDAGMLDYASSDDTDGDTPAENTVDEWGYRRVDNITDSILARYRDALSADSSGATEITKDDIFYYVYGLLHDPNYRETYAADLKKMLPHIPDPGSADRFRQLADAGRALAVLHVDYESVDLYPLDVQFKPGADPADRGTWRVDKMRWKSKTDHSAIIYNSRVTIAGIPDKAHRYMLGSRSALAWILDRYQVKTDKASGIVNNPNDWCDEHDDPTYVVDLIKRVTTVSVETMRIVDDLGRIGS